MKPQDIFGIIIRSVGLFMLLWQAMLLVETLLGTMRIGTFHLAGQRFNGPAFQDFSHFTLWMIVNLPTFLIAGYMVRGAPRFIRYCYPETSPEATE